MGFVVGPTWQIRNEFREGGGFAFRWGEVGLGEGEDNTPGINFFFQNYPQRNTGHRPKQRDEKEAYQNKEAGAAAFQRLDGGEADNAAAMKW